MSEPSRIQRLAAETSKFLTVGAAAYVVDLGVFNLVLFATQASGEVKPVTAKIVSTICATLVAYLGNKSWTYSHRAGRRMSHELVMFFGLNGIAMLIAVACLGVSHYLLDLTSPLADNVSANIIGVALGTIFRFFTYRKFVFAR